MKKLLILIFVCSLLAFGIQAHALSITPGSPVPYATGVTNPTTPHSGGAVIDAMVASLIGPASFYYKQDVGGGESGTLAGSYQTTIISGPGGEGASGATISYTGGTYIDDPQYLLVKDGNNSPYYYLFDLTNLWNGRDTLELSNFWIGNGAISHVSLYGTHETPSVPEPGTILLLGGGLLGLGFYGRKRMKV